MTLGLGLALGSALLHAQTPQLIFASGYEPNSTPNSTSDLTDITGTDSSTGDDWSSDLDSAPGIGNWFVEYTGGTASQRWARIVDEPGNTSNKILWFNINQPNASNGNGRVQASLYGNSNFDEFTFKNRLYLHPDLNALKNQSGDLKFFTLFEFWNNPNWFGDPHPFRISVNMTKAPGSGQPFHFDVEAQTDLTGTSNWFDEWEFTSSYDLPVGQWFEVEIYVKEGNASNGRFKMAITPDGGARQVIFDLTVLTHHPSDPNPDGFSHWNPQKLYTSSSTVNTVSGAGGSTQVYWDDFELWRGDAFGTGGGTPPGNPPGDVTITIDTDDGVGADTRVIGKASSREDINDGGQSNISIRRQTWLGALFVGYLRFDLATLTDTAQTAELALTFADPNTAATGTISLYGLNDGYAGGPDGDDAAELGESWGEGTKLFATATGSEIDGDNAPGFVEGSGTFSSDLTSLQSVAVGGESAGDVLTFDSSTVADFINADTDGQVTFVVAANWTSGAEVRFVAKEGTGTPPTLTLTVNGNVFSPIADTGDRDNYVELNPTRWDIVDDGGDQAYSLTTTSYGNLSGGRLGEISLYDLESFTDFELEFDARSTENLSANSFADYAAVFGYVDANTYNYMIFNRTLSATQLFTVTGGSRSLVATASATPINNNDWDTLKLTRSGTTVTVQSNGSTILTATASGLGTSGKVGVGAYNDQANFDNIAVTATATPLSTSDVASADTFVQLGSPNNNYGGGQDTLIKNENLGSNEREAFYKFPIDSRYTSVTSATLRLYSLERGSASSFGATVEKTSTAWAENTLTWNNSRSFARTDAVSFTPQPTGQWNTIDVTAAVQAALAAGDSEIGFVIVSTVDDGFQDFTKFASKENTAGDPTLDIVGTQ